MTETPPARAPIRGKPSVKVLYIAGSSRCGSTVLGNIMGELDGFFNGGEIRFLWRRVLEGRRCGCGRLVDACPVWTPTLPSHGRDRGAVEALDETQRAALRLHHTPRLLRRSPDELLRSGDLARYAKAMAGVYERLSEVTRARVVVDSSKRPSNAAALSLIRGIDPYLVHLVRDPRGVAYSRLRRKPNPDGAGEMPIVSPWKSASDWMATNLATEDLRRLWPAKRTMQLRYEDFIEGPRRAIDRIASFVDEPADGDPFEDARAVRLGVNHTVSGNPDRFQRGSVNLRADEEWRLKLRPFDRRATTALTMPLLLRYHYALRAEPGRTMASSGPS